ncbi:MAG TPA: flagellar protein [Bacteroidetes bacterium]|nr:flagellar protein [Bacteroidota bacterium]
MIALTRLHGEPIVINADLIEFIEPTPDTMISTTTGKKIMVKETIEEVIGKVVEHRRRCNIAREFPSASSSSSSSPLPPPV